MSTEETAIECCAGDRQFTCRMAVGERVRFTMNDYKYNLTNGELGTITQLERSADKDTHFEILTDTGRCIRLKSSDYCNDRGQVYLTQAYAVTVYSSQGLTIDGDTFVLYTGGMDRANTYVACSRHKDACHIYVNGREIDALADKTQSLTPDKQALNSLAALMMRDSRKKLAIEYLDGSFDCLLEHSEPSLAPENNKGRKEAVPELLGLGF